MEIHCTHKFIKLMFIIAGLDLYFEALIKQTYRIIVSAQYPTFQLKTANSLWSKVDDVMFYTKLGDIHDVLIQDNFPLTFAPAFVYEECKAIDSARAKNCSPSTVKAFYAQKWTEKFGARTYGTIKEMEAHNIFALTSKSTVKLMLSYILLSDRNLFQDTESLSAILENSPLLCLASGDMGVFKRASKPSFTAVIIPVSVKDLIPEALHRCVLQEDMGLFEQHIANWNEVLNIPKLDLALLAKLMDEGAPSLLRKTREQKVPYLNLDEVPKDTLPRLKQWLQNFYAFLSTYNPLSEQMFIELFESWPILLARVSGGGQRLYPLSNRKLILAEASSGVSAQAAACFNILQTKLCCPVLVVDDVNTSVKQLVVVNQFLNSLVGHVECLEVLNLIEYGIGADSIDLLSDDERDFLFKRCIETRPNSSSDSALFVASVKKFPFFRKSDGTYSKLGDDKWYLLPSESLPVALEGKFLLPDDRFNDFYVESLKICKLSLVDCYKTYILKPEIFNKFGDQQRMNVMTHMKDNHEHLLKDGSIANTVSTLQCVIVGDQWLRPLDCFDPTHPIFSCFFAHKCLPLYLPPYSNNPGEWLYFLRAVGLRKSLSQANDESINSSSNYLSVEGILLSVALAIERAAISAKASLVVGAEIGIRNKSGRVMKAVITKLETTRTCNIKVSGKYTSAQNAAIIIPWCEDAMCEPISGISAFSDWPTLLLQSNENSIPISIKGVFYFLEELTKAYVNKLLEKSFFGKLANISCIPLLYKMGRRVKLFGTPPEIANSNVCEMVPSCYPTYFGLVDFDFNRSPMRKVWSGKFPFDMEEAMGMVTKIFTKDLLSHIKYLVAEGSGEIRRIGQQQMSGRKYEFGDMYSLFNNYKRNLIELQNREDEFPAIEKELLDVPFVWIYEKSTSRLMDVKNSFFELKRAFGNGFYSHIIPDLHYYPSQRVGYACSIPDNLADVKQFLTKMGVRDLPTKSDLLGYLRRLKDDFAASFYNGDETVLLSSLILKIVTAVSPNEKLSLEVFLPTDSKQSATSQDSFMFSYPEESIQLMPAKSLILIDDENYYKRESLLNFDCIHFFKLNEAFDLDEIQSVLPLLSLREVINIQPTHIGNMIKNAEIARINKLIKDPEFLCALFRLKVNDLLEHLSSDRSDQKPSNQNEKIKLRAAKWRLADVCKFVQSWLPTEIVLNEIIQVAYFLRLSNAKVNITSDRFYKTDSLYITKGGRVRKNKDENDNPVIVDFFEFVNGAKGPKATIPMAWKSSYDSKFYIIDIVTDDKSNSELVVFKPENLHVRESLCFVNPKMPCSRNTVDCFLKHDADKRRILHVANPPTSNNLLIKVSLSIDKGCLMRTKQPFPHLPGISFAHQMSGETMDTFRALLMNPPESFPNIFKSARIPYLEIHSQEPGDQLSDLEIKDLYFPQQGELIRFFEKDIVAVKRIEGDAGQGDVVYRYARVRSTFQSVLTLVVSLEPEEATEECEPAKSVNIFKLKKDIPAMRLEIEQEFFDAEVNLLCMKDIDVRSSIELVNVFLGELEALLKKGQDMSMKIPVTLSKRIDEIKSILKILNDLKKEREKLFAESNLPPPPPPPPSTSSEGGT